MIECNSTYKTCLIGLGNIAWKYNEKKSNCHFTLTHSMAYLKNQKTQLVAGCSPLAKDRKHFSDNFGLKSYFSLEEMIEKEKPDIVSICSPKEEHFKQIKYCIDHDVRMVWLEKPPVLRVSEIDQLIGLNNNTKILVNYQRRYSPIYLKLKTIYDNRELGECHQILINYSKSILENGSHLIDYIFFLLNDYEDYNTIAINQDSDNCISFRIKTSKGINIIVLGEELSYHNNDVIVTFDEGRVSILHGGFDGKMELKQENELYSGFYRLVEADCHYYGLTYNENSFDNALEDLINSYECSKEPVSNLVTARSTVDIIANVQNSSI